MIWLALIAYAALVIWDAYVLKQKRVELEQRAVEADERDCDQASATAMLERWEARLQAQDEALDRREAALTIFARHIQSGEPRTWS